MNRIAKPEWLKINRQNNANFSFTGKVVREHCLHTICESGRCPNQAECWNKKTATFMIAGEICTRTCKFCNTLSGKPLPLDPEEPEKIAQSIKLLGLKHAVITSVDRDDLPDFGAEHWVKTIEAVKKRNPQITMEVLIPDLQGKTELLDPIIQVCPDIISHNMETVERLTPAVRSVARYKTSLVVLKHVALSGIPTKSGLMLGLGETKEEVVQTMEDLLNAGCRLLSIGQYLQPSKKNIPVVEYILPNRFAEYRQIALSLGFRKVESAPFVRSSYHSSDFI
ncbi:lipoyl synthase [Bacteroidia bacterium]|nr:lipoyl synthase [Bacteroidia bacterium]